MNIQLCNSGGAASYSAPVKTYSTFLAGRYTATKADVGARFYQNLRRLRFDTLLSSSVKATAAHESFREIVSMGEAAVPYIISEIRARPDLLILALPLITGDDPVQPQNRGRLSAMATDWLDWYRRRG